MRSPSRSANAWASVNRDPFLLTGRRHPSRSHRHCGNGVSAVRDALRASERADAHVRDVTPTTTKSTESPLARPRPNPALLLICKHNSSTALNPAHCLSGTWLRVSRDIRSRHTRLTHNLQSSAGESGAIGNPDSPHQPAACMVLADSTPFVPAAYEPRLTTKRPLRTGAAGR